MQNTKKKHLKTLNIITQLFHSTQVYMLLGGENYIVGFLRVMLTFSNPHSHRCCCWKNKVPGKLTSAKRIKWKAKAGLKKLKGIVGKMHAEEETLESQFISCSSAYCLPGQHSRCNTQLAQLHFMTPIVSSGSVNKDFLNLLKPMSNKHSAATATAALLCDVQSQIRF